MTNNTKELKSLLHESIENIDDEAFLKAIKNIMDHKYQHQEKIALNPEQEKRIEKAKGSLM